MAPVSKPQSIFELHFGWVVFLSIAATTFLLYQHALQSAFFLDDASSIRNEPLMSQPDIWLLFEKFRLRFVGYLSFWLNYQISGENPASFRLVNFAIHAGNGILVYWLSSALFREVNASSSNQRAQKWVALGIALIFVAHPLQTQAVTYIVQRLASLVAFFYLMALCAWIQLHQSPLTRQRIVWFTVFVLAGTAACFTKQNAFTMPLVLALFEIVIFRKIQAHRWLLAVSAVVGAFLLAAIMSPQMLLNVDALTRETEAISRWEYLSHQWVVLWIYLSKVIWPYPQVLDYGIELYSFSNLTIAIAGIGHAVVIGFALRGIRRYPLVSLGILFFYLTHSLESGLIPIRDLAFEHRNYLPLFGLFFACGATVIRAGAKQARALEWAQVVFVFLFLFFAQATYSRNQTWAEQEALLKQDVAFNSENVRAKYNLAVWYDRSGRPDKALATVKDMLRNNDQGITPVQLTLVVSLLIDDGQYSEALDLIELQLARDLPNRIRGDFLRLSATAQTGLGNDASAVRSYERSMRFTPLTYEGGLGYGYSLIQLGFYEEAEQLLDNLERRFGSQPRLEMLRDVLKKAIKVSD